MNAEPGTRDLSRSDDDTGREVRCMARGGAAIGCGACVARQSEEQCFCPLGASALKGYADVIEGQTTGKASQQPEDARRVASERVKLAQLKYRAERLLAQPVDKQFAGPALVARNAAIASAARPAPSRARFFADSKATPTRDAVAEVPAVHTLEERRVSSPLTRTLRDKLTPEGMHAKAEKAELPMNKAEKPKRPYLPGQQRPCLKQNLGCKNTVGPTCKSGLCTSCFQGRAIGPPKFCKNCKKRIIGKAKQFDECRKCRFGPGRRVNGQPEAKKDKLRRKKQRALVKLDASPISKKVTIGLTRATPDELFALLDAVQGELLGRVAQAEAEAKERTEYVTRLKSEIGARNDARR